MLISNCAESFAVIREMLETPGIIDRFKPYCVLPFANSILRKDNLFLTGEGSSRIFPAKNAISVAHQCGLALPISTEGARQAMEYDLSNYAVFGASNSGRTKEAVGLFAKLRAEGHDCLFALTAHDNTPLEDQSHRAHVLSCGAEDAVAATKSVIEQALFYQCLIHALAGLAPVNQSKAACAMDASLHIQIDPEFTDQLARAPILYFAGRNDGVAEELTLKTNEITGKKSAYLEGTYAVHGVEEIMAPDEAIVLIDPFEAEQEKFYEVLVKGLGLTVIAIAERPTIFPTILIPHSSDFAPAVQLAAGWNLLVQIGMRLGRNLDKPVRARKVGNEVMKSKGILATL